jgi:hypothetical protein
MNDTDPAIAELVRQKLMARSGEERMIMGARSFESAKRMILASFPPNLPPEEVRRRLFKRVYGKDIEEFVGPIAQF